MSERKKRFHTGWVGEEKEVFMNTDLNVDSKKESESKSSSLCIIREDAASDDVNGFPIVPNATLVQFNLISDRNAWMKSMAE